MTQYLDEKWFERLKEITQSVDETFIMLEPDPDTLVKKRAVFEVSGYKENISLFPDTIVADMVERPYNDLLTLQRTIISDEPNEDIRWLYTEYIDEMRANMRMIQAAGRQDAVQYDRENAFLFGRPDRDMYMNACDWIRYDVVSERAPAHTYLARLGQDVLNCIPDADGDFTNLLPAESVFQSVRASHFRENGFYDRLYGLSNLEKIPAHERYTPATGDAICQQLLTTIGANHTIVDAPNITWAVSQDPEVLFRPVNYDLNRDEFIGITGHEIGSHILESINGARLPIKLFERGLAGFVKGNEGRALIREQIVYADAGTAAKQLAWEYNIMKHLAVCLSLGYNGERYTFSQLYDTLYKLYVYWRERRCPGDALNEAFARENAWFLAVRIQKGTDGNGGCYRKDIVYLEGNVKLWQAAEYDPEVILLGDQAKFNLLDARQRQLVQRLITEAAHSAT